MTPEQLLVPRIKCVTAFLGMEKQGWEVDESFEVYPVDDYLFILSLPEKYPHNFKLLEWWEERDQDVMPQYVKRIDNGEVDKVDRYDFDTNSIYVYKHIDKVDFPFYSDMPCELTLKSYLSARVPATEQEYNNQKKDNESK